MSNFISPGWLWALIVPLAAAIAYIVMQLIGRRTYALRFANAGLLEKVAPKRPGWRRHLVSAAMVLAMTMLVIALARPQAKTEIVDERTTIMLAIDVSRSMAAEDVDPSRIESAKSAAVRFVESLPAGAEVGLVSFAGSARVLVPPTADYVQLAEAIKSLELADGTAIGDAVELSLQVLGTVAPTAPSGPTGASSEDGGSTADPNAVPVTPGGDLPSLPEGGIKASAAVVVLSDGTTTMGLPTEDAIPLARTAQIPVWTISYGTAGGVIEDVDGSIVPVPVDPQPLAQLAEQTGGKAFEANSSEQLDKIYDQLKTATKPKVKLDEIGWRWSLAALITLALSSVASMWWFNRFA